MRKIAWSPVVMVVAAICLCFGTTAYGQTASTLSFATVVDDSGNFYHTDMFKISEVAPWDLSFATIELPDETETWSSVNWKASYSLEHGSIYLNLLQPWDLPIQEGDYTYLFSDEDDIPIAGPGPVTYSRNDLPVVEYLTFPADEEYISSTTPTFTWDLPQNGGALYYQVVVTLYDGWVPKWNSPLLGPGVNEVQIPSGIMESNSGYRWSVKAYDQSTIEASRNISISANNKFYIGSGAGLPANLTGLIGAFSRVDEDRSRAIFYVVTSSDTPANTLELAPWDTAVEILGPDVDHTLGGDQFYETDYSTAVTGEIAGGTYTFTVIDTRDDSEVSGSLQLSPSWNMTPLDRDLMYQVPEHSYIYTEQPTFQWEPVADADEYRIRIRSYSDPENGYYGAPGLWASDWISGQTIEIPSTILSRDNAYSWEMETKDASGNRTRSNRLPFFIAGNDVPLSISGQVTAPDFTFNSDYLTFLEATDSPDWPGGESFSYIILHSSSQSADYTLHNIPRDTDVYLHALYDHDGTESITVGDRLGSSTAINSGTLGNPPAIPGQNVVLSETVTGVGSFSGEITCDDCDPGLGNIIIEVYGDDEDLGPIASDIITVGTSPFLYSIDDPSTIPTIGDITVWAFWDVNNDGIYNGADQGVRSDEFVADPTTSYDLTITTSGFISGIVTDSDSSLPLPNILVSVDSVDGMDSGYYRTGDDGSYYIAVPEGEYKVWADPQNWQNDTDFLTLYYNDQYTYWEGDSVTVDTSSPGANNGDFPYTVSNIDFSLIRGVFITGTVEDLQQNPVEGVEMTAENENGSGISWAITDENGYYELYVPPNTDYFVAAMPQWSGLEFVDQYYMDVSPWDENAIAPVNVGADDENNINFTLERGVYITGIVEDLQGTPIGGLVMDAQDSNFDLVSTVQTESDGTYSLMVPKNQSFYILTCAQCTSSQYPDGSDFIDQIYGNIDPWGGDPPNVYSGEAGESGINFTLTAGVRISGVIRDPDNDPIEGLEVSARDENVNGIDWDSTDSNGAYSLLVPQNEDVYIYACPQCSTWDYPNGHPYLDKYYLDIDPWADGSTPNVVVGEEDVSLPDIILDSGFLITGTVTSQGAPVEGILMIAQDENVNDVAWSETEPNGSYSLMVTDGQSYYVRACTDCQSDEYPDGRPYLSKYFGDIDPWNDDPPNIAINGADVNGRDFSLTPGTLVIGTVYEPGDPPTPIAGLDGNDLYLEIFTGADECGDLNWVNSASIRDDGTFVTPALPQGSYFIKPNPQCISYIQPDCTGAEPVEIDSDGPGQYPGTVDFTLQPGSLITGHIEDSSSNPLSWVPVTAVNFFNDDNYGSSSDDFGDYCIGVPQGVSYYVEVCTSDCGYNYIPERYNNKFNNDFDPVEVTGPTFDNVNFVLQEIIQGDINGDESVQLDDAIISLKMLSDDLGTELILNTGDVDGDYQIGLPETIYILNDVATP